jgi:hypothetical protein
MRKYLLIGLLVFILLLPVWMWLGWVFTPNTKLVAAIIDKTVLTREVQEHISFNWILNHQRYTKTSKKAYESAHDYYGFFPLSDEKFELKGLERFSSNELVQLSEDADLVYFTDTYGIYNNEWYKGKKGPYGIVYGGLSNKDVEFLSLMKAKNKLILTEFNTIGSPTRLENRARFEELFAIKWTGWTARYFDNLDIEVNKEIPLWLIDNYKKSHQGEWPFKRSGIAFVNDSEKVVILEDTTHLTNPMPHILSKLYAMENLGVPEKIKYPFWFDIILPQPAINQTVASFKISANQKGLAELEKFGIPSEFPAVTMHKGEDYSFYYFSGDFSDNPINLKTSYFKGIRFFKGMFYNENDPTERAGFFWNFYRPMLSNILKDYSANKP